MLSYSSLYWKYQTSLVGVPMYSLRHLSATDMVTDVKGKRQLQSVGLSLHNESVNGARMIHLIWLCRAAGAACMDGWGCVNSTGRYIHINRMDLWENVLLFPSKSVSFSSLATAQSELRDSDEKQPFCDSCLRWCLGILWYQCAMLRHLKVSDQFGK